jgi:hypothetical protein
MDDTSQASRKEEQLYIVKPSGKPEEDGKRYYTDEAITGLFSAHIENLCSEQDVVWQRYNILLGVNTALLGAMAVLIKSQNPHWPEVGVACGFGWMLCYLWWRITQRSWDTYILWEGIASRFRWPALAQYESNPEDPEYNPFVAARIHLPQGRVAQWLNTFSRSQHRRPSVTYTRAWLLILLYAGGYAFLVFDFYLYHTP